LEKLTHSKIHGEDLEIGYQLASEVMILDASMLPRWVFEFASDVVKFSIFEKTGECLGLHSPVVSVLGLLLGS